MYFQTNNKENKDDGGETIENIESFIETEKSTQPAKSSVAATTDSSKKEDKDGGKKKDKGKSKEEWVSLIFGEEHESAPQSPPKKSKAKERKSVYDLEPDNEEFSGNYLVFLEELSFSNF